MCVFVSFSQVFTTFCNENVGLVSTSYVFSLENNDLRLYFLGRTGAFYLLHLFVSYGVGCFTL